jgi:hypothetical protein
VEPSPSWKAARNLKVDYRVHKSPPLIAILSQINPVHTTASYFYKIRLNIITHQRLGLPSGLFPSSVTIRIPCAFLFSHLAKTTGYEAPHYVVFSKLLPCHPSLVHIVSSSPCSWILSMCVFHLMSETRFHVHTKLHFATKICINFLFTP